MPPRQYVGKNATAYAEYTPWPPAETELPRVRSLTPMILMQTNARIKPRLDHMHCERADALRARPSRKRPTTTVGVVHIRLVLHYYSHFSRTSPTRKQRIRWRKGQAFCRGARCCRTLLDDLFSMLTPQTFLQQICRFARKSVTPSRVQRV